MKKIIWFDQECLHIYVSCTLLFQTGIKWRDLIPQVNFMHSGLSGGGIEAFVFGFVFALYLYFMHSGAHS